MHLPIKTLFEKSGILINSEGTVQQLTKVITSPTQCRNSSEFFQL